ncbi:MAG: hypothetical protein KDK70_05530 [Myxococcales bacterium]|nr:hypothetical protein [Myxococcales bacterium]
MSSRGLPGISMACAVPLLALVAGCPGDDGPALPTSGTSDDTSTTSPTTTSPTTTSPTTTSPTTTVDGTGDGSTGDTTASVDTTATTEPPTTTSESESSGSTTDPSGSTTMTVLDCGNGVIDPMEECDSGDVGASTCADHGYDAGVLGCDDATCSLDFSGCYDVEALQNDNGMCDAQELGCTNMAGTGGNPQDLLECFQSTLVPPIDVVEVEYSLGSTVPLPTTADLVVHAWAGPGNPPGVLIDSFPLDPVSDIVLGFHTFVLPMPSTVATASFCVGLHGSDFADGFLVDFTNADNVGESWLRADACGLAMFVEATTVMFPGNFCIRPTVTSPNP